MSERTPSYERGDGPVTGNHLLALFDEIDAFNDTPDAFSVALKTVDANEILSPDADPVLINSLHELAQSVSADRALSEEILVMRHERTLQQGGFGIYGAPGSIYTLLADGQAAVRTLGVLPAGPEARQRLRAHLEWAVSNFQLTARDFTIVHEKARVETLVGEIPEHWMPLELEDWPAITHQSIEQMTEHAPGLAERLVVLGATEYAVQLRRTGRFFADGDRVPWAVAGWYGFLPEVAMRGSIDWMAWKTHEQWSPLFRTLQAANPAGAFGPYLAQHALATLEKGLQLHADTPAEQELQRVRQQLQDYQG